VISILTPAGRDTLERLARAPSLLAFDFDGTLAPIVPDRSAAELRPATRDLLRAVALLYPTAVISGRSRRDAARRLDGIPLAAVIGNHGAEPGLGPDDRHVRALVRGWREALGAALGGLPGVEIEDKDLTLAVHYRHASCRAGARRRVLAAARLLDGARVLGGHAVVNVVLDYAPDKGRALERLKRRTVAARALYAGDDVTDEDAFRSRAAAVAIRVGRTQRSAARFYLPDQSGIDDLLRALLTARARLAGRGERWQGYVRAMARS
jgi:trehalose 6-phosphate phosphatase